MSGEDVLKFLQSLKEEELKLPFVKAYYNYGDELQGDNHDEVCDICIKDSYHEIAIPLKKAIIVY